MTLAWKLLKDKHIKNASNSRFIAYVEVKTRKMEAGHISYLFNDQQMHKTTKTNKILADLSILSDVPGVFAALKPSSSYWRHSFFKIRSQIYCPQVISLNS